MKDQADELQLITDEPGDLAEEKRRQNALRLSLLIAVLMIFVTVGVIWVSARNQVDASEAYITASLAVVAGAAAWLSWRKRVNWGMLALAFAVALIPLVMPFVTEQRSIQVGIITIIIVAGLSAATLPPRVGGLAIVGVTVAAVIGILLDYFLPMRHATSSEPVTNITLVVALLLFGYFALRDYRRYSMRVKLIVAFVAVAMIPLTLLALVNNYQTTEYLTEASQTKISEAAETIATSVDNYLKNQLFTVRVEAQLPDFVALLSLPKQARQESDLFEKVGRVLAYYSRRDPIFINSYALIDSTGLIVQDINPENIGKSEIGQEYFLETLLSGYPTISNVYFDDSPSLFIAAPVRTSTGEIIGVLRVRYDARILQAILLRERKTDSLALYSTLLDDAYYIRLADSHLPESNYKSFAPLNEAQVKMLQNSRRLPGGESAEFAGNEPEVVEGILASKNSPIFTAPAEIFDGETAMVAVKHLDEAPWIVMVRQSVRDVQAPVEAQTRLAVVLSLAALVLIAGVAFLVSQALSAPLTHLKQVAEQVALGDLSVQAKISTPDEVGLLASTFNMMTRELRSTLEGLEQRVADRTRAIKLSAEVGRRLSTILDSSQLVTEVVQLLQQAFNYYHVHIYLLDEAKQNLVMMGGTGEAGKMMLERGHKIPLGKGLVGRAGETGTAVLAADTSQEPDWLSNPLLPDTRAEIAVPILLGDEVLGVLDVQQNSVYGLGRDDMELLYGIAAQVAIALRNAGQYTQAQRRAQREALTSQIIQQIQETRSVERALQIAVRELGRALGMERTRVRIGVGQDNPAENSGNGKSSHE